MSAVRGIRGGLPGPRSAVLGTWLLIALALGWSALAFASVLGVTSIPFTALLALPAVLVAVRLFRRGDPGLGLNVSAALTATVALALLATIFIRQEPVLVVAFPAAAIAALVVVRRPVAAVVLLFALTASFGTLAAFFSIPAAPIADVLLGGLWLATIWWYLFHVRERPAWLWPGVALIVAYLAVTAFQVLTSPSTDVALRSFRTFAWYLMAVPLMAYAPWFQSQRGRIARGFVVVALIVGAYATFRWVFGQSPTELNQSVARSNNEIVEGRIRLIGSFLTGKELALWTACIIPFCLACALTFAGRWRAVALAACGACAIAMFGSDVRVGIVAVVPAILAVVVLYQLARGFAGLHLGTTLVVTAVIALIGAGAFALTLGGVSSTAPRYKVLITDPTSDASYQARVFKWNAALRDIRHHPLGQGLGTSGDIQKRFGRFVSISTIDVDNSYLKIALEQGFAVMMFFILCVLALLYGLATRALSTLDRERAGLAIGAVGSLIAFAVFMFAGTYIEGLPALGIWVVVGLGVAQFSTRDPDPEPVPSADDATLAPPHAGPSPEYPRPVMPRQPTAVG